MKATTRDSVMKQSKEITARLNQLAGVTKPTNKNTFKTTKQ